MPFERVEARAGVGDRREAVVQPGVVRLRGPASGQLLQAPLVIDRRVERIGERGARRRRSGERALERGTVARHDRLDRLMRAGVAGGKPVALARFEAGGLRAVRVLNL